MTDREFALSNVVTQLSAATHWAIKANLDQSVISELKHLHGVANVNFEEERKKGGGA